MPPIRKGDGTPVTPKGISQIRTGDGRILFDGVAIPDSALTQNADHIWYMDEGSGSTVADSVGTEDGTISESVWSSGVGAGDFVVENQNAGDIITIGDGVFNNETSFTVVAWGFHPSGGDGYLFQQNTTDVLFQIDGSENITGFVGDESNPTEVTPDEGWIMGAITYDGSTATIYAYDLDGEIVTSSWSAPEPSWDDVFSFGNRPDGDRTWIGGIDYGVVVHSEATESDIQDHYESTVGLYDGS